LTFITSRAPVSISSTFIGLSPEEGEESSLGGPP